MLEFMIGLILGVFVAIIITAQNDRELKAENRHLREALRNVRHGRAGIGAQLLRYIDRVLNDEAGA